MSEVMPIIGSIELVDVCGRKDIPAKIDTGADSSAIWATHIKITEDGFLKFKLFGPKSPFYNGKVIKRKDFKVAVVRSATGQEQIRYRTHFTIKLGGKKIRVLLNLSDRKNNNFPILIGRRSISKKFLVDVSKVAVKRPSPKNTRRMLEELQKNPYEFYQKYAKLTPEKGAKK